jgi:pimeloyl-ACP methyl ester carboxylesterase
MVMLSSFAPERPNRIGRNTNAAPRRIDGGAIQTTSSALSMRGLRAVAFDLPGLGLAERPEWFDYSLHGLGKFSAAAVDALGIDRYHLVVHDACGPIGFELAIRHRARIRSLTITNTVVELVRSHFPGEVLARSVRRVPSWLASARVWRLMMYTIGIADRAAVPAGDVDAYRDSRSGATQGPPTCRLFAASRGRRRAEPACHLSRAESLLLS